MFNPYGGHLFLFSFRLQAGTGKYACGAVRLVRRAWCLLAVCLVVSIAASAQYRIDSWTTETGLPQNSINDLVQTRDGYLWLATNDGLARFDGVRFKVFNKANSEGLDTNRISQVHEDGTGRLWISGEDGSLLFYEHGKFTVLGGADDPRYNPRGALIDDGEGGVIYERDPGKQRFQFKNGAFVQWEQEGIPESSVLLYRDNESGFWFSTNDGFYRLKDRKLQTFNIPGGGSRSVFRDRYGNFWLTADRETNEVFRVKNGQLTTIETPTHRNLGFTQDNAGNLWLFTYDNGILRLDAQDVNSDNLVPGNFQQFASGEGMLSDACRIMIPDREGGVWAGSEKGLHHLSPQIVRVFSKKDGLQEDNIYPILQDHEGTIWLGAWQQSLIKYDWNGFSTFLNTDAIAFYSSLFEDRDGTLWFGKIGSVYYLENGKPVDFTEKTALRPESLTFSVISQDKDGAMWFGASRGLSRYLDGQATVFTTKDGLPNDTVYAFLQARDGRIWAGTRDGVAIGTPSADGELTWSSLTENDGLASNYTRSLYEDAEGVMWIGSYDGGLTRFKDGKITGYSAKDGLTSNGVFCILEDDNGWLWMNSNQGIYRVRKQELNDFADGKTKFLTSIAYGKQDGLLNIEGNGGRQPAGIRAIDGRLWFPMAQGVAVIDPKNISTNPMAPPVLIEDAMIERRPVDNDTFQAAVSGTGKAIQLSPGQNNLEVQYTGLSFINSEQVKFKYKLEGAEDQWNEVGNRRSAFYSYLPPGDYTFHVLAANRDGVWNEEGAMIRITVNPAYYQTWWFLLLCTVAVALIIRIVYRYRLAQLEKVNAARTAFTQQLIEYQENERKRIAVELHDSIGQSLIVIRNRALMSLGKPDRHEWMAAQMEEISDAAADSIAEVRQIAHNLHPYQLEHLGLTTALETMIETAAQSSTIRFSAEIDDVDDTLSKEDEVSLYRIVQEGVNNILKHSGGSRVNISLRQIDGTLDLTIEDNGAGFTPGQAEKKHGLGLTGIGERARMLKADYKITSAEGKGTKISLQVKLPE